MPTTGDQKLEMPATMAGTAEATSGDAYPLGATLQSAGANFSVFASHATGVEIVLFDHADDLSGSRVVTLDPSRNRTADYWHVFLPSIQAGQLYGFRVDGPSDPANGQRYDSKKILLDPYGKSICVGANYDRGMASRPGDNAASCMKSVVIDPNAFDWQGDKPLNRSFRHTVIYEMHVAGFTRHPNSGVAEQERGSYLGLLKKIPYLQNLGITAIELLPVFAFDPADAPHALVNYWGYSPVSFFAPHWGYSTTSDPLGCLAEFKTMVREMHKAGIEVILDVVFNHAAEGDERGPTLCLRGFDNEVYYLLNKNKGTYANYTGAGNTLKANHPVVRRLILDSLRYWVSEMHVDGFRFDLASVFSRDENGTPMANAPILAEIDSDPVLAGTKLIAEAWDEGGLYQVGSFGPGRWKEWNGQFRDDMRKFVKADESTVSRFAQRLTGSFDLYGKELRPAGQSINFVTCHDGFTLNDLVSYNAKHNEANLELDNDGDSDNHSWNCGAEGSTTSEEIDELRLRQTRNLLALTLLSVGTPMLLMGDEVRRTQRGNNNAYCQDNETSWFDWDLVKKNAGLLRFATLMIQARLHFEGKDERFSVTLEEYLQQAKIEWHGTELGKPDWSASSHCIALTLQNNTLSQVRYIAINEHWESHPFELPPANGSKEGSWMRYLDTSLPSPLDVLGEGERVPIQGDTYVVSPRSMIMLQYDSKDLAG
jgi:isoamylase